MYIIYNILIFLVTILYIPVLLIQVIKGKYREGLKERFGFIPEEIKKDNENKPTIWIQAASLGETMAAKPLVEEIREKYPKHRLIFSTMTETGRKTAQEIEAVDHVIYFPLDISFITKKVINGVRPDIVILIETELWPNFIKYAREFKSKVIVASGRISDDSINKYKYIKPFMKKVLAKINRFSMQTESDAQRIKSLGAPKEIVEVNGNIKFDRNLSQGDVNKKDLYNKYQIKESSPVLVAGSTHADEEEQLLQVYNRLKQEYPALVMIIAPRYPKRVDEIEKIFQHNNINTIRRTKIEERNPDEDKVIIVDTIGELVDLYNLADLVFVGGSLMTKGGHNILEPAAQGKLPIFGPHMFNFRKDTEYMLQEGAAIQVEDSNELTEKLYYYLNHRDELEKMGKRARKLIEENKGAARRNLKLISNLFKQKKRRQILLIRLSAMGDVIHALPIAKAIRNKYPEAEISWIVEKLAFPLVEMNPYLDQVICLPKNSWKKKFKNNKSKTLHKARDYFRTLKRNDYDLAIDVHGLFKSAFTAKSSGAAKIYGPADGRELSTLFYSEKLSPPEEKVHQIERNLTYIESLAGKINEIDYGLEIDQGLEAQVEQKLSKLGISFNQANSTSEPLVMINPFTTWESKNWIKQRYGKLADKLIKELDCQVIFTGGPDDKAKIDDILRKTEESPLNLAGRTNLKELTALYDKSDLFIGGDTGPMHLAAAVGLPVLALMGPTDPVTHGPYGKEHHVLQADLPCKNCWNKECKKENYNCMKKITVDQVYNKAAEMLKN